LDVTVHAASDLKVLGRASTSDPSTDITKLTNKLAVELLRVRWDSRRPAGDPAMLATPSLPALRAYLDGELAVAAGRFRAAAEAFQRALRADSTFWLAYWRHMYALGYHGEAVDSAVVAAVITHRASFPEADRKLVEVGLVDSQRERIERLRDITRQHPNYWQAWFDLGDRITHHGPLLGIPLDQARAALRRTVALNPYFVPAWQHLFWAAIMARDTAESGLLLAKLVALQTDTVFGEQPELRLLDYYRYLDRLAHTGGRPDHAEAEIGARVLSSLVLPEPERLAATFTDWGFFRAQLDLSRRVRERAPGAIAAAHTWGAALAWAGRGAWDSALVSARQYARVTDQAAGAQRAFGLAVVGAWLRELPPEAAHSLKASVLRSSSLTTDETRAETAWLSGLLACAEGDAVTLRNNREFLERSAAPSSRALARSLSGFERMLAGKPDEASRLLAELEWQNADRGWHLSFGAAHPFVVAVNRIAASRQLLLSGDTTEATRLLLLHETNLSSALQPAPAINVLLGSSSLHWLADIAEARGDALRAQALRARALEQHDLSAGRSAGVSACAHGG
jgi:tetratricopeptide (TPR) repeat protein